MKLSHIAQDTVNSIDAVSPIIQPWSRTKAYLLRSERPQIFLNERLDEWPLMATEYIKIYRKRMPHRGEPMCLGRAHLTLGCNK